MISGNFNCKGVLPEFCIDIDVFFLRIFCNKLLLEHIIIIIIITII